MSTTDPQTLYRQLLRPPILHILRAIGFTRTRPAVLETLIDLTSRYLTLLAYHTAQHAYLRQPLSEQLPQAPQDSADSPQPPPAINIIDIRMALQEVGALQPQVSELEEQFRGNSNGKGQEDMRGIHNFLSWCRGDLNAEIRRVAGMIADPDGLPAAAVAAAVAVGPDNNHPTTTAASAGAKARVASNIAGMTDQPNGQQRRPILFTNKTVDPSTASAMAMATAAAVVNGGTDRHLPPEVQSSSTSNMPEDYLTALKKKHSKTGEESRWQGTLLGKEAPPRLHANGNSNHSNHSNGRDRDKGKDIFIDGWESVGDLSSWGSWIRETKYTGYSDDGTGQDTRGDKNREGGNDDNDESMQDIEGGSESSSPLSEIGGSGSGSASDAEVEAEASRDSSGPPG